MSCSDCCHRPVCHIYLVVGEVLYDVQDRFDALVDGARGSIDEEARTHGHWTAQQAACAFEEVLAGHCAHFKSEGPR